jgi:hypothetical protein
MIKFKQTRSLLISFFGGTSLPLLSQQTSHILERLFIDIHLVGFILGLFIRVSLAQWNLCKFECLALAVDVNSLTTRLHQVDERTPLFYYEDHTKDVTYLR